MSNPKNDMVSTVCVLCGMCDAQCAMCYVLCAVPFTASEGKGRQTHGHWQTVPSLACLCTNPTIPHPAMMLSSSANGHSQSQPQWTPSHRASQSSISSLSQPLSPALTARLQASFLWAGLQDALQFKKALDSIQLDPVIRAAVTKCTLLQLFILICVTGVDWLLLPTWTRGSAAAAATSSGRQRISEEQARFYFQVGAHALLCGLNARVHLCARRRRRTRAPRRRRLTPDA